jgi:hypothetical protein
MVIKLFIQLILLEKKLWQVIQIITEVVIIVR